MQNNNYLKIIKQIEKIRSKIMLIGWIYLDYYLSKTLKMQLNYDKNKL